MSGLVVSLVIAMGVGASATSGPATDYGEALASARRAKRPLLIILDSPQSRERRIEVAEVSQDSTQAELLQHYQLCHVNVATEYGKQVARAFRAKQFPHTAIIDKTGSVILFKKSGRMDTEEWVTTLLAYRGGVRKSSFLSPSHGSTRDENCFT